MTHELAEKVDGTGKAMFYVEDEGAPWHKHGTALKEPATAAIAIREAGLDQEIISLPMYAHGADGTHYAVPSHYLNVRSDNMAALGVVSDRYKIIQNRDAFSFLDSLAGDGELRYHTAGALGVGERIWIMARLKGDLIVKGTNGADRIQKNLFLYNSHDGSSALRCLWTATRVVCWNTAQAALRAGEGTGITIRHTGEIDNKIEEARRVLGLAARYFQAYGEGVDLLAGMTPSKEQLEGYFKALYPDPPKGDGARAKATRMALFGLFENGIGQDMPGVRGTAYAALNAVTEFVDHHTGTDERRRLESALYGDGAKIKAKAFDAAVAMATS